ncbi:high-potential iron-sulfur protein [Undibacterium terreum]|uniref:High-potential iron-sulfur protein n=1 Tax=Undibacterium terreum TaxID=1224302 RepID=A0A916U9P2_9BURK|nr:high-potential iron-sulfur protein [Undibacterium terreum]GGC65693.1 high-potential iron-sulfur protein [Undibacterium terreum]
MTSRRQFVLLTSTAAGLLSSFSLSAHAQAAKLQESDPQALALGYKEDANKVDAKKYPAFAAGHICSGCALYQGKATDVSGACGAMAGKLVSAKGWCIAWAKKA